MNQNTSSSQAVSVGISIESLSPMMHYWACKLDIYRIDYEPNTNDSEIGTSLICADSPYRLAIQVHYPGVVGRFI